MKTGWVSDRRLLEHETGPGHPERPSRLAAIQEAALESGLLGRLTPIPVRRAPLSDVLAVHTRAYLTRLDRACRNGARHIDVPDSAVCPVSYDVALLAAGGVLAACDAVLAGQVHNAFCAIRPPGHHCDPDRAMGFCLLNNVAIAARYVQRRHGVGRVLILDWDVHHGNGTQNIFERDGTVLYCSLHEHPTFCYPGTGYAWERGEGPGKGCVLNLPMPPHATDADYRAAFTRRLWPLVRKFRPEFVLVSAGFDAHRDDPLAGVDLTQAGFDWLARQTKKIAEECCAGRLVGVLEGGYNLQVLTACVLSHVRILLEDDTGRPPCSSATE